MGTELNNQPKAHVHGASAYVRNASTPVLAASTVIDALLTLALFFVLHRALGFAPVPRAWWLAALPTLHAMFWAAQKLTLGRTLGHTAWGLEASTRGLSSRSLLARVSQPARMESSALLSGALVSVAATIGFAWSVDLAIFRQPLWAAAETLELDAYLPDMASGQWEILPFFYSLGAWPKSYAGKPVLFSLPYEKGPPTRFAGHVIARWEDPATRVTFEGPKTPAAPSSSAGTRAEREQIRECLIGHSPTWSCLKIREATLGRHLLEMQHKLKESSPRSTTLTMQWKLRWFLVRNAALPAADQAQGIYLSAHDGGHAEERYILITENGTHQAVILDYLVPGPADYAGSPATLASALAKKTFEQAIRSLRASDELAPGRAWVDRQLESIHLPNLAAHAIPSESSIADLASAQAKLIAKISVEPRVFESYFHLAGTALLLNRVALAHAGTGPRLDLSAVERPLIHNAYLYAQDIAPLDPRTTQLQGFWLESKKP